MIVSQRLVRKLCPHCKKIDSEYKEKLSSLSLNAKNYQNIIFYTSVGCEKCMNTGYIGRLPIFEIVFFDEKLRNSLLKKEAIKSDHKKLLDDGIIKAEQGLTSLDELLRQLWKTKKKRFYFLQKN